MASFSACVQWKTFLTPFNKHRVPAPLYFRSNNPELSAKEMLSHGYQSSQKKGG